MPLRHRLIFGGVGQRFGLVDEVVESKLLNAWNGTGVFYRYKQGNPVVRGADGAERALRREDFAANQSVLSQLKDPVAYPEITYLGREYPGIRLYRQWDTCGTPPPPENGPTGRVPR